MLDIALKVELAFSRSVGEGKATTRKIRGLTRSVMALMVPPFPAPSRPSKTMHFQSLVHYPALQFHQLNVEFAQRFLVRFVVERRDFVAVSTGLPLFLLPIAMLRVAEVSL